MYVACVSSTKQKDLQLLDVTTQRQRERERERESSKQKYTHGFINKTEGL